MNNDTSKGWVLVRDIPEPKYPPFVIENILHEGPTIMYGRPESGKTTLALSKASCLVTGEPWFDYKVRERRKVGFWGLDPVQKNGVKKWVAEAYPALQNMPFTSYKPGQDLLSWKRYCRELLDMGVDYVIIDNIYRLMPRGKSVRDDDAVGPVLENVQILVDNGIGVLLLHHAGKPGEDGNPKTTPVGSTAIEAWGKHFIRVEAERTKVGGVNRTIYAYGNDLEKEAQERLAFKITKRGIILDESRDFAKVDKFMIEIIEGAPWKSQTEIAEAFHVSQPTVQRTLVKSGYTLKNGEVVRRDDA